MSELAISELIIDGESRPASDGALYDVINPARPDELVGMVAEATTRDIDPVAKPSWLAGTVIPPLLLAWETWSRRLT